MRTLFYLPFFLFAIVLNAQTPAWSWAKTAGAAMQNTHAGGTERFTSTIATDSKGNSCITGHFVGTAMFGTITVSSPSFPAVFTAKYDSSGNCLWVKHFGAPVPPPPAPFQLANAGRAIGIDSLGACYVTGVFNCATSDTIYFGSSKLSGYDNSRSEIFLVKYDANGNEVWATQSKYISGVGINASTSLSVDKAGNSWLSFYMTYDNQLSFGNLSSVSAGGYVVKHNSLGIAQWVAPLAISSGPPNGFFPAAVKHGTGGSVYITGHIGGTCTLATSPSSTCSAMGANDALVFKLTANGNVSWVKQFGNGLGSAFGRGIDTDPSGNVYFAGDFTTKITIGTTTLSSLNTSNNNAPGVFIAKLDPNGNVSWANLVGLEDANIGALKLSQAGDIYTSGAYRIQGFYCNVGFPGTGTHLFVGKINSGGTCLRGHYAAGEMMPGGLALDSQDNVFIAGNIIGNGSFDSKTTSAIGVSDAFIAKLTFRQDGTSTGISEESTEQNIVIYPNPFEKEFTISFTGTELSGELTIQNLLGQEVVRLPYRPEEKMNVYLQNLPSGLYTYQFIRQNRVLKTGKLIAK